MASLSGFNAAEVEPSRAMEPLPAGWYLATIIDSETKPTKAGTGSYLSLIFEILDGPHKSRKLYANLNLENPSEKAVQIARAELSAICRAVNVLTPKDSVELHNLPLRVKVGCERNQDTKEIQNRIKGYESKDAVQKQATANSGPVTGGAKPWERKPA